ncbi:hypothetical protein M9Y10_027666 [Tritrichomonas musculus]|uniref:Surface antigen BspA-like n=1 Tax=Tritrichomonas musculus TaxID=1915356 RepID=A0ABR2H3N4_9EUKA
MAFFNSSIVKIFIPPQVTKIGDDAFTSCKKLKRIEIPNDSKLQTIGSSFLLSQIESIFIPPNVTEIGFGAFHECKNLKIIEFAENSRIKNSVKDIISTNVVIMIPKELNESFCINI